MSEKQAKGCLIAASIWCVILVVLAVAYKFLVHPFFAEKLTEDTGSASQYQSELRLAADSFSGYAILRSAAMREALKDDGIKLTVQDDQADYDARMQALKDGDVDLAVFTVDSYLTAGARLGEFPGSIILMIDETKGGDAVVARTNVVANLQALNDPDARIVVTPNSPSEFLARVVLAHFDLPLLPDEWVIPADGASAVLEQARRSGNNQKRAYVLWEPYVSQAVNQYGFEVLLDSSKLKGYVVDVLVARRSVLRDKPEQIDQFLQAYFRAAYRSTHATNGMKALVQSDARQTGMDELTPEQAERVVAGIEWKNTLENYAHFGLDSTPGTASVQHLEDIIMNIMDVLVKTGALAQDPLEGRYNTVFYQQSLANLKDSGFHPAKSFNLIPDLGPDLSNDEAVRVTAEAGSISDSQWDNLRPVGELRVKPLVFVRGSSNISLTSKRDLADLAKKLKTFPEFYVRVVGQTRAEGDADANRVLATRRAEAAYEYLVNEGIGRQRLKTEASPSQDRSGASQSVRFVVGQLPY